MTTQLTAEAIAEAAQGFPFLGIASARDLLEAVRCELGHAEILDDFRPYSDHLAMAIGPECILHIVSGNTPHAALQSLIRGLLLKSHNLCKLPAAGLPQVEQFRSALPPELGRRIEIGHELSDAWLQRAEAVIVFGSDDAIEAVRARIRPGQRFIAHGHAISFGLVAADAAFESVAGAARDVSLFDQQGCLSPHLFYVRQHAAEYARRLAAEMDRLQRQMPRGNLSSEEHAAIAAVRNDFAFRAANDPHTAIYQSAGSTAWTVILDPDPTFTASCLNRVVFVKPWADDLAQAIAPVRRFVSTIGIWPATLQNARHAMFLGASRICPIGSMQAPPFTWHQDGAQTLAPLVRWIDLELS